MTKQTTKKQPTQPARLFISYSHRNEDMRDTLGVHLKLLQRQEWIVAWHDRRIIPGMNWAREIDTNLASSDIVLLLVSADFIASDYCWNVELKTALRLHNNSKSVVIPIFLRPCDLEDAPFMHIQGLPGNGKPISTWNDPDEAWKNVAEGIRESVENLVRARHLESNETVSLSFDLVMPATAQALNIYQNINQDLDLITRYLISFRKLSFLELLRHPNDVESTILAGIRSEVTSALLANGFIENNANFINDSTQVCIEIPSISCPGGRSLNILIETTPSRGWYQYQPNLIFNEFGAIREVIIFSSEPLPIDLDTLAARVKIHIETAYSALERVFINKVVQTNRSIFRQLYDFVSVYLKSRGKEHLLGLFWLILANEDIVVYFFDEDELRRTINHYKNVERQAAFGLSPFELTCTILTETFPFDKSLAIKTLADNEPMSLPWVKAEYLDHAPLIHKAEQLLYNSEDYTGYVPCSTRGYHLIVGCPTKVACEVMPEFKLIRSKLCVEFQQAMRQWSAYITLVTSKI